MLCDLFKFTLGLLHYPHFFNFCIIIIFMFFLISIEQCIDFSLTDVMHLFYVFPGENGGYLVLLNISIPVKFSQRLHLLSLLIYFMITFILYLILFDRVFDLCTTSRLETYPAKVWSKNLDLRHQHNENQRYLELNKEQKSEVYSESCQTSTMERFVLKVSSVIMIKPSVSFGSDHIEWRNP